MADQDAALVSPELSARLHRAARAARWRVSVTDFGAVLGRCARALQAGAAKPAVVERQLEGLHLEDLALACACASGDDEAWEEFVRRMRPGLYRAADALDSTGGARDLADELYGDLFGRLGPDGERRSLFRYYHGRSALATWLRALLAQRHVDRWRRRRRETPLVDADAVLADPPARSSAETESPCLAAIRRALGTFMAACDPRERLRLACYYARELTLAETGRLLGEHEATTSRRLARSRDAIRNALEQGLAGLGWSRERVRNCLEEASSDSGPLDLGEWLDPDRKNRAPNRSTEETAR